MCNTTWYVSRTRVDRFPLDPRCPAPAMCSTRNFEEFGRELDVVGPVLDDLDTALARVVFKPRVAIQTVALVAPMARPWFPFTRVSYGREKTDVATYGRWTGSLEFRTT